MCAPPLQQRRRRHEQMITRMVAALVMPFKLPEITQPLPPQPVHRIRQIGIGQRHHLPVAAGKRCYPAGVQAPAVPP